MTVSAVLGAILVGALLALLGTRVFALTVTEALLASIVGVALHYIFVLIHQLGHAWVARRLGWPMVGIRFWTVFGTCLYPVDEPPLPASLHIQRALGGPIINLLLGTVILALTLLLLPAGSLPWLLGMFAGIDNILMLSLGALFFPLGFNDASTVLYWLRAGRRYAE